MSEAPRTGRPAVGAPIKTVRIMLEENDAIPPVGQYIGVNGRGYLLKPGLEVDVPQGVVDALDNAIEERPQLDPATKQVIGYTGRLRFPYRVIRKKAVEAA